MGEMTSPNYSIPRRSNKAFNAWGKINKKCGDCVALLCKHSLTHNECLSALGPSVPVLSGQCSNGTLRGVRGHLDNVV